TFGILLLMNIIGIRLPIPYIVGGILLWVFVESAGLHGTLAGILMALTIPARAKRAPGVAVDKILFYLQHFEKRSIIRHDILEENEQHRLLEKIKLVAEDTSTPLQRWEYGLE